MALFSGNMFAFTNGTLNQGAFSRASPPSGGAENSTSQRSARMSMTDPNRKKVATMPVTLKSIMNCSPAANGEAGYVSNLKILFL